MEKTNTPACTAHAGSKQAHQLLIIESLTARLSEFNRALDGEQACCFTGDQLERQDEFPCDTQDLIRSLCDVQFTLLEERRAFYQPFSSEDVATNGGDPYVPRKAAISMLDGVLQAMKERRNQTREIGRRHP